MRCSNGHDNPGGQRFCGQCGEVLGAPSEPADAGDVAGDAEVAEPSRPGGLRRWTRWPRVLVPAVIGLALLAGVVIAIILSSSAGTPSHTIIGSLTLTDTDELWSKGDDCQGSGGYDDIRTGAQVVVKDGSGRLLGTSSLLSGTASDSFSCDFAFFVDDVPDADFYSVEVSHRGEITNSRKELEDNAWIVGLTLGS
jgi:hypothetical protein